jgi:hypothetical protein
MLIESPGRCVKDVIYPPVFMGDRFTISSTKVNGATTEATIGETIFTN